MSAGARFIVFFLLSFLDVRVKAELLFEPAHCEKNLLTCHIRSTRGLQAFKTHHYEVRLIEGSYFQRINNHRIRLEKGSFLIQTDDQDLFIETIFGVFKVRAGLLLFDIQSERVDVINISSQVSYTLRGTQEKLNLPEGLQTSLSGIQSTGKALHQYPRSPTLKPLLSLWSRFYTKENANSLKMSFDTFSESWTKGLRLLGPWYSETVERQLADQKAEEERQKKLSELRLQELNYYKNLFKQKNFLDQLL